MTLKTINGAERTFIIGTLIWIMLQMSRFVAVVLINDIDAGLASEAWRYPAYLDLFAAVAALPLIWAVWARRGVLTWAALIVYWAVSIVDHIGNFLTSTFVGPPTIAEGMDNPLMIPMIQTAFDVVFLVLLLVPRFRDLFFKLETANA